MRTGSCVISVVFVSVGAGPVAGDGVVADLFATDLDCPVVVAEVAVTERVDGVRVLAAGSHSSAIPAFTAMQTMRKATVATRMRETVIVSA